MSTTSNNMGTLRRSNNVGTLAETKFLPSYKSKQAQDLSLNFDVAVDDSNHLDDLFCVLAHRSCSPVRNRDAASKSSMRRRSMETTPPSSFSSSASTTSSSGSSNPPALYRANSDSFANRSSMRRRSMESMPTLDRSCSVPSSPTGSKTGRRRAYRGEEGPATMSAMSHGTASMSAPVLTTRRQRLRSIMMPEDAYIEYRRSSAMYSPCSAGSNSLSSSFDEGSNSRLSSSGDWHSRSSLDSFDSGSSCVRRSDSDVSKYLHVIAKKELRKGGMFASSLKGGWGEDGNWFERWMLVGLIALFLLTSIGIMTSNQPRGMRSSTHSIKYK